MAKPRMDLTSFVGKLLEQDDVDALREGVRILAQAVMETEVSGQIGALPYERSSERTAYRNGYRTRAWDTRVGTIELKIPKVTAGSYFPALLEPRRRAEKALHAVVVEAYVKGVSTRKVDDLVKALGIDGISKSEVSRLCKVLDQEVEAFRSRPIDEECPYVILDATFHKTRELDRVVSVACVVAVGVTIEGERRVLGVDCGPSEDEAFWTRFLRSLVKRGLKGVRLVVSDAHEGLRSAIAKVLSDTQWQRCRVHFMRNLLSTVPRAAQETVAAFVRTIFYQPDHQSAMTHLGDVVGMLRERFPQAADLLEDSAEDVLAHMQFPKEHRRRLHSTNTVERLHMEIKRRTRVIGIFPNRAEPDAHGRDPSPGARR
jgi:putative transposase